MWFPLAHLYSFMYESSTFAIVYGIKSVGVFWEHLWKLDGNTLGTEKKQNKTPFPTLPKPKRQKLCPPKCMWSLLIGHMRKLWS